MQRSHWFTLSIFWAILTWHLTSTPQPVVLQEFWLNSLMMMSAHFIFFGIQAVLLHFSFLHDSRFKIHYSVLLTSTYGALVEFNQYYIPGRSADPLDWALDTLGAIIFLLLFRKLTFHT